MDVKIKEFKWKIVELEVNVIIEFAEMATKEMVVNNSVQLYTIQLDSGIGVKIYDEMLRFRNILEKWFDFDFFWSRKKRRFRRLAGVSTTNDKYFKIRLNLNVWNFVH